MGCSRCGTLRMWDVEDVRCLVCWGCCMLKMWDVWDVECSGSGIFEMWNDMGWWRYGMLGCAMLVMWDVWNLGCSGCGMFGMWDVGDARCLWCGMSGVWNVGIRDVRDVECGMLVVCQDVRCWFTKCIT